MCGEPGRKKNKKAMTFRMGATSGEGGAVPGRGTVVGEGTRLVSVLKLGAGYVKCSFSSSSLNSTYNYIRSFVCNDIFHGKKTALKINKKSNEYVLKQNAYFRRPFKT